MGETKKELTKVPLGPTGRTVAENVKRLMQAQNLTFSAVVTKLAEAGRPIPLLGVRKIVNGLRRVDADDLAALAVALGVTPNTLLMPRADQSEEVSITGLSEAIPAGLLWAWLQGTTTIEKSNESAAMMKFLLRAWPEWEIQPFFEFARETGAKMPTLQAAVLAFGGEGGDDK